MSDYIRLMSYSELTEYLDSTPEIETTKAKQKLDDLEKRRHKELLDDLERTADILRDVDETNLNDVLERLDKHLQIKEEWAFLDSMDDDLEDDLRQELKDLKAAKKTPWAQTRELNDRFSYMGRIALDTAKLCELIRDVPEYMERADKAGQLFVRVALAVQHSQTLPKDEPKNRDAIRATYKEGWDVLQSLIDDGLDTLEYGYGTVEQSVTKLLSEPSDTDSPF